MTIVYLTTAEVMKLTRYSRSTIYRMIRDNENGFKDIVCRKVTARKYLFDKQALLDWIEKRVIKEVQ